MYDWLSSIVQFFLLWTPLFLAACGILRLSKELRARRGALAEQLCLDDLLLLAGAAGVHSLAALFLPLWAGAISALGLSFLGLLVLIDAMLFVQYRIEVNRQTLAWFFTGSRGLKKGIPHLLQVFEKYPAARVLPVLVLMFPAVSLSSAAHLALFAIGLLTFGIIVTTTRRPGVTDKIGLIIIVLLAVCFVLAAPFYAHLLVALSVSLLIALTGFAIARKSGVQRSFLTTPTLLTNLFADDRFLANESVVLSPAHQQFVTPPDAIPKRSELFGQCRDANIILITLESLGAYVAPYTQNAAHSRLTERFREQSWVSQQHFCLCPNTTVSTNQMYTGGYSNNPYNKDDSLYPGREPRHIKTLKAAGYKTLFLDSADIGLYDYHKLLSRINFDKVWGTEDIPANGLKADYRLWNMVDEVAAQVGKDKFFLHLINDQTHMPYEVVDSERFNRHSGGTAKDVYLNAVEEVDYIFDEFLTRLSEQVDLSNTLLVFTGDHGESFGEHGYSFHSNSVIQPQIQVPFFMTHPSLTNRQIEHSCHFDLFPTFFDLLGIECDYPTLGTSLAHEQRDFAYFFHSATLKGNTPANFGFMLDGEMLWMDRLFNQVAVVKDAERKTNLPTEQKEYIKTLLFRMLKEREILV